VLLWGSPYISIDVSRARYASSAKQLLRSGFGALTIQHTPDTNIFLRGQRLLSCKIHHKCIPQSISRSFNPFPVPYLSQAFSSSDSNPTCYRHSFLSHWGRRGNAWRGLGSNLPKLAFTMFATCSHSARNIVAPKDGFRQLPQRTVRPVSNQAFAKLAKRTIMPVLASRCYRQGIFLFKSGVLNLQMSYDNIGFPRGRGLHLGMASE
jgi:hypothetical protein